MKMKLEGKLPERRIRITIENVIKSFEKRESGPCIQLGDITIERTKEISEYIRSYLKLRHPEYIIGTVFNFPADKKIQIYLTSADY